MADEKKQEAGASAAPPRPTSAAAPAVPQLPPPTFEPLEALYDVLVLLDELAKANTQAAPMGPAARTWSKTARIVNGHLERAGLRTPPPSGPNVLKTTSPYAKPAQRKLGG